MTPHELERQYVRTVSTLRRELGGRAGPGTVETVGRKHFERLRSRATITDFIPLLVYRATKDELTYGGQSHGTRVEFPDAA